ncbi:hypothetical protein Plhal304r1_c013g0049071 [Plasmopara halstedii]
MAARVTKLFLQNVAADKVDTSKSTTTHGKRTVSSASLSKNATGKRRKKSKTVSGKPTVKVLEDARRELKQANRTLENLRKLKNKTSTKSQRLMAKVLALRTVASR